MANGSGVGGDRKRKTGTGMEEIGGYMLHCSGYISKSHGGTGFLREYETPTRHIEY